MSLQGILTKGNGVEENKWPGIPEKGTALEKIVEMEKCIGDPEVEAYEEVSACALTCKTCKSLECKELGE